MSLAPEIGASTREPSWPSSNAADAAGPRACSTCRAPRDSAVREELVREGPAYDASMLCPWSSTAASTAMNSSAPRDRRLMRVKIDTEVAVLSAVLTRGLHAPEEQLRFSASTSSRRARRARACLQTVALHREWTHCARLRTSLNGANEESGHARSCSPVVLGSATGALCAVSEWAEVGMSAVQAASLHQRTPAMAYTVVTPMRTNMLTWIRPGDGAMSGNGLDQAGTFAATPAARLPGAGVRRRSTQALFQPAHGTAASLSEGVLPSSRREVRHQRADGVGV